jgi:uncharacterized protein YgiM (DUF1202 family)
MKKTYAMSVFVLAGLLSASVLHAETAYYVQSVKAKVMSGTSFKSAVLGEVGKGFKFLSSGKEGAWVKVRFNDKDGFVHSLVLATHPPLEKTAFITGDEHEMQEGVRRRASSFTSAAAARGLATDDRKRLSTAETADYEGLDWVDSFTVSPEELRQFMEGKNL